MNRRQFFGMTAASLIAAGLPLTLLPEKTIFLPPRWGWRPYQLGAGYMREVEQYLINIDEMRYRYDAIGRDFWGTEHQFHVETRTPEPELAARLIADRFQLDGLRAIHPTQARQLKGIPLPAAFRGRYI